MSSRITRILFTADPVSGNRTVMSGNYIFGLGEALVSGEAEPYTFTLKRPKGDYEGPSELEKHARQLFKMATRLERELGQPQDIEWCIANGRLYLLQSRPITTLLEYDPITCDWNSSRGGDYLWGDAGGVYPEVLTPGGWSVLAIVFDTRVEGIPFLGNIGGRIYVNFSMIQSLLERFGQSGGNIWSLIVGEVPEGVEVPTFPVSIRAMLSQASPKMLIRQRRMKSQGYEFLDELRERCHATERRIRGADKGGLITLWEEDVLPLCWDGYLIQDASNEDYAIPYGALKKRLVKLIGESETDALIATIGGEAGHMASAGIALGLHQVAAGEMSREEYLEEYGHRHANENEIAARRPIEDPRWLDEQLALLAKSPVDPDRRIGKRAAEFDAAWSALEQRFPKQAPKLRKRIDKIVKATQMREAVRSEYTRSIYVVRQWYLRAGALTGLGDDIFFLTHQDVLDLLAGDDAAVAHIPVRREVYEKYRSLPAYPAWIRGRFDPVQWAADPNRRHDIFDINAPARVVDDSRVITGYAGSAGQVEGTVRRIASPEEGDQLQAGEILIAVTTNVGWTPLFSRAAAVVTDIGASLAHAAIVARELGIPAVVGCGDATIRLKTGDRVRVDGSRGTVEILASN